jgi:hypothetical protein
LAGGPDTCRFPDRKPITGYDKGCRCPRCKDAKTESNRRSLERRKAKTTDIDATAQDNSGFRWSMVQTAGSAKRKPEKPLSPVAFRLGLRLRDIERETVARFREARERRAAGERQQALYDAIADAEQARVA